MALLDKGGAELHRSRTSDEYVEEIRKRMQTGGAVPQRVLDGSAVNDGNVWDAGIGLDDFSYPIPAMPPAREQTATDEVQAMARALIRNGYGTNLEDVDASNVLADFRRALPQVAPKGFTVRLSVVETHDGQPCDCIDANEMTLTVGDKLELTHTCYDGRVDKIIATIVSVEPPKVEHGKVTVTG